MQVQRRMGKHKKKCVDNIRDAMKEYNTTKKWQKIKMCGA